MNDAVLPTSTGEDLSAKATRGPSMLALSIVGALVIIMGDTQGLSLIPLVSQMESEFGITTAQVGWILAATSLAAAATVPTILRMSDRFGSKRFLLGSLAVGAIGNVICATAPDGEALLLVGRIIVGMSGVSTPLMYAILRARSRSESDVQKGSGLLTAAAGVGVAVGFLTGGIVVHYHGTTRTVFWLLAAFSLVILLVAHLLIPETATRTRVPIDLAGMLLLGAGMLCVVLGINKGEEWGWGQGLTITAVGIVLLALFCGWELRSEHPMVDLRVITNRRVLPAMLAAAIFGAGVVNVVFLTTSTYVETPSAVGYGLDATPLGAAFHLLPNPLLAMVGGLLAERAIRLLGSRRLAILTSGLHIAVFLWLAANHSQTWHYVVGMSLFGFAFGLGYAALYAMYLAGARLGEAGLITGAGTLFLTILASGATTLFTLVLTSKMNVLSRNPHVVVPDAHNYTVLWLCAAAMSVLVIALVLITKRSEFRQELAENTVLQED